VQARFGRAAAGPDDPGGAPPAASLVGDLLRRLRHRRRAVAGDAEAAAAAQRARRLDGFLHPLAQEPLVVRCAWCDRICVAGVWVPPTGDLTPRLGERATHGICPDCLERLTNAAAPGHDA